MICRSLMVKSTSQIILSWGSKNIDGLWEFSNILLEAPLLDAFLQLPWEQTLYSIHQTILFIFWTNITVLWVIGTPLVPLNEPEVSRALESVISSWCRLSGLGRQWWCWRCHRQLNVMDVIYEPIQVFINPSALSQIYLLVSKMAERILQLEISHLHGNLFPPKKQTAVGWRKHKSKFIAEKYSELGRKKEFLISKLKLIFSEACWKWEKYKGACVSLKTVAQENNRLLKCSCGFKPCFYWIVSRNKTKVSKQRSHFL